MKKATDVFYCSLFALIVLLPAGVLISACFGYTFELISTPAFALLTAAVSLCTVVFSLISKESINNKTVSVLLAILAPLSFISAAFYMYKCSTVLVVVSVLISVGCCCVLAARHGWPSALKIVSLVLSGLMVLPICFLGLAGLLFGNIGQNTVVQTLESPSGEYYAQVIDSDQGALGGDTLVDVYRRHSGIDAVIFKIEKQPQRVYWGEWGEFKNMQIHWKDDDHLIINSVEYEIG